FVLRICGAAPTWTMESFVETTVPAIRARVGDRRVLCALSGGVDSAVTAAVVDLLRGTMALDVRAVDARARFLANLRGVEDPEQKRRIIGATFIDVFEEEARGIPGVAFLAQGTL